jgi:hypothetical protein
VESSATDLQVLSRQVAPLGVVVADNSHEFLGFPHDSASLGPSTESSGGTGGCLPACFAVALGHLASVLGGIGLLVLALVPPAGGVALPVAVVVADAGGLLFHDHGGVLGVVGGVGGVGGVGRVVVSSGYGNGGEKEERFHDIKDYKS